MKAELKTERLYLREMTLDDAQALFCIWSDPDVTKFMNVEAFKTEAQAIDMIKLLTSLSAEKKALRFTMIETGTNTVIGSCGYNEIDWEVGSAEIGYELDQSYWGKGYGTEAITALIHYAFDHLQLKRMVAKVEPANAGSIKILEKLHFRDEGEVIENSKGKTTKLTVYVKRTNKEEGAQF